MSLVQWPGIGVAPINHTNASQLSFDFMERQLANDVGAVEPRSAEMSHEGDPMEPVRNR